MKTTPDYLAPLKKTITVFIQLHWQARTTVKEIHLQDAQMTELAPVPYSLLWQR